MVRQAVRDSFSKLGLRHQVKNPVMFVVFIGSVLTTVLFVQALIGQGEARPGFILGVALWLWFTLLFANFAEAMAEGRGKAQAQSLRQARQDLTAKKLGAIQPGVEFRTIATGMFQRDGVFTAVAAGTLMKGDVVLVEAGDFIPADGEVIAGIASVNESAITGESAPVIRESGDRSAVTGGTRVLSDWLIVTVTAVSGESFLDRMIALVEGAKRQKTPNEIALNILLAAMTIIFLLATVTLLPFSLYSVQAAGQGSPVTVTVGCRLRVGYARYARRATTIIISWWCADTRQRSDRPAPWSWSYAASVGKTVLLDHLADRADGCRVGRAVGVQSEMELADVGLVRKSVGDGRTGLTAQRSRCAEPGTGEAASRRRVPR